jgi:hypothetical protein
MSTRTLLLSLALAIILAGCGSGRPASEGRGGGGLVGSPAGIRQQPFTGADPVVVQTPTGPVVVPRDQALETARQHGGGQADIYEPGAFHGQRHSTDSKN